MLSVFKCVLCPVLCPVLGRFGGWFVPNLAKVFFVVSALVLGSENDRIVHLRMKKQLRRMLFKLTHVPPFSCPTCFFIFFRYLVLSHHAELRQGRCSWKHLSCGRTAQCVKPFEAKPKLWRKWMGFRPDALCLHEDPDIDEFEVAQNMASQIKPDVAATNKASFVEVCTNNRHEAAQLQCLIICT